MPKKAKKEVEKVEDTIEEEVVEPSIPDTPGKAAYRVFLEKYRKQNPVKYEQKKAEFERKLKGDITYLFNKKSKTTTFKFFNTPPRKKE